MTKKINIVLLILLAFILSSCTKLERHRSTFSTMGSAVSITMDTSSKDVFDKHYEAIKKIFDTYHELATNEDTPKNSQLVSVYVINKGISESQNDTEKYEIKKELYELIAFALEVEEKTTINDIKYLDISMGNTIDLWKKLRADVQEYEKALGVEYAQKISDANEQEKQKLQEEMTKKIYDKTTQLAQDITQQVASLPKIENPIKLIEENNSFFIEVKKGVKIDLGAIAKGYALEVVRKYLIKENVESYLISAGSSSLIVGSNYKKANKKFLIGMVNPEKNLYGIGNDYYATLELENSGITTSGNHEQFVKTVLEGKDIIYHHIISPKEKRPLNYYHTISLITEDVALADALTTAMFNMPLEVLETFIETNNYEVIYYTYDGKVYTQIDKEKYQYKQGD